MVINPNYFYLNKSVHVCKHIFLNRSNTYSHTSYLKIYKKKDIIKISLIRTTCFKVSEKMPLKSFALHVIDFFVVS